MIFRHQNLALVAEFIGVDDIGQIHVIWESGGRLALVPGVDEYEILK